MAPSKTSIFLSCNSIIFSSIEFFVTNRTARTARFWPMRWARWMACISTLGFHHGSIMRMRLASCKLSPSPPALRLMRMTRTSRWVLNAWSTARRSFMARDPTSLTLFTPLLPSWLLRRHSTRSSISLYCENTIALLGISAFGSSSLSIASISPTTLSTLVLELNWLRSMRCRMDLRPSSAAEVLSPLKTLVDAGMSSSDAAAPPSEAAAAPATAVERLFGSTRTILVISLRHMGH
mmetsp:Transcript_14312/g.36225  ORF Transcript_14312/g.36225 Transcript_14312/m.36225 type:complete len:236 (-) Transcript_14312:33-740(-)